MLYDEKGVRYPSRAMPPFCSLLMAIGALLSFSASVAAQSDLPIPLRLAEPAVQHALKAYPEDTEKRRKFIEGYVSAYLYSLRSGESFKNLTVKSNVERERGYTCAYKEIVDSPTRSLLIEPDEFGYRLVSLTGVYRFDLELSEFVADDGAKYHVEWGGNEFSFKSGQQVKLSGWLSPQWGLGFGHVNRWKQEVIVLAAEAVLQ